MNKTGTGKVHLGYLHFEGTFARHVQQEGAHYREKTVSGQRVSFRRSARK